MIWMAAATVLSAYVSYQAAQQASRDAAAARNQQDQAMGQQDQYMVGQTAAMDRQTQAYTKAAEDSLALQREQLTRQQSYYDEWQATFGPIQKNLAGFYSNLSEADVTNTGLQTLRDQYATVERDLRRNAAARGVDSAATTSMQKDLDIQRAEAEARLRNDAKFAVASAKSQFLGSSGQMQNPYAGGIASAYGQMASGQLAAGQMIGGAYGNQAALFGQQGGVYGSRADMYGNQAANFSASQQAAMQAVGQSLVSGASGMAYEGYRQPNASSPNGMAQYPIDQDYVIT